MNPVMDAVADAILKDRLNRKGLLIVKSERRSIIECRNQYTRAGFARC